MDTCRTCKWWTDVDDHSDPQSGVCTGNRIHDLGLCVSLEDGKRGPSAKDFRTSEYFGCVRHEKET